MNASTDTPPTSPAAPPTPFYYSMVLAEVIFEADGELQMLTKQFFTKADTDQFRAHRLRSLQNTAVLAVKQGLPADIQATVKVHEVFIKNVVFLGLMTDAEFWEGLGTPPAAEPAPNVMPAQDASQAALEAEATVAAADIPGERMAAPVATVTPIRPVVAPVDADGTTTPE